MGKMVEFMGEKIAQQAYLVVLVGIVLSIIVVAVSFNRQGIMVALVVLLSFFIYAYNVNCTIVGRCSVWAWLLTVLYILNGATIATALVFSK
jgi:hypothetical protein